MKQFLLAQSESSGGAGAIIGLLIGLGIMLFYVVAGWKVFTKAGQPGWASLIPIYNLVVFLKIVGRPVWWIVLMIIPLVNVVIIFMLMIDLAKSFGKGAGFGVGLIFLGFIFYPILGYGSAQYVGPAAAK